MELNASGLINSNEFVSEPVNHLNKVIFKESAKKIILEGGRGCGKTVLLKSIEKNKVGSDNPTIYTHFNSISSFAKMPNELFNYDFFEHYYELIISLKIINYIETYYSSYSSDFFKERKLVYSLLKETDNYLRNIFYQQEELSKYLKRFEISKVLIDKMKFCFNVEDINLMIDRFDWVNNRSGYTQNILKSYFDLFNKTIITSDTKLDILSRREIINKGYIFEEIRYGKNIDILKEIIRRRIELYNKVNNLNVSLDIISDNMYEKLIYDFGNDISSMISVVLNTLVAKEFYKKDSINNLLLEEINNIKEYNDSINKSVLSPKLYL